MQVVSLPYNQGKWGAIKSGFNRAKNPFCVILDADLSVDPETIEDYRKEMDGGAILLGDRYGKYASDNNIPFKRRFFSRAFNRLVKLIVGLKVRDSQCPWKCFPRSFKIATVFIFMKENGFAGDVEFLARAGRKGIKLREVDVVFNQGSGSTVNIQKHAPDMFKALLRIRRYLKENTD
jgi:glycosyltransferase involved in cell wall biosynthesis